MKIFLIFVVTVCIFGLKGLTNAQKINFDLSNAGNNIPPPIAQADIPNPGVAPYKESNTDANQDACSRDVAAEVPKAMVDFDVQIFKKAAPHYNSHFILSEYSVWLMVSALAEAATGQVQEKMFQVLKLPKESCLRAKYYQQAFKHEKPGSDIQLFRSRFLVLDDGLTVNQTWADYANAAGLLRVVSVPMKSNPALAIEQLNQYTKTKLEGLKFKESAMLLDTFDYKGIWSTAFPNANILNDQPFYNEFGKKIGMVDYINIKRRVRIAYLTDINVVAIELPIGTDNHYSLIICLTIDARPLKDVIESLQPNISEYVYGNLVDSKVPIDITLPRIQMDTNHDNLQLIMEETGLPSVWDDPIVTKHISQPAAGLGSFVQRIAMTLDVTPAQKALDDLKDALGVDTGVPSKDVPIFQVNRPFIFTLANTQTRTCIVTGAYSMPSKI